MGNIASLIKYEGDNSTFIWKHPEEDFNSLTQLVVHESQEAIFFMNGQALDLFGPGRYTLETQNIPKIGKVLKRSVGDSGCFLYQFLSELNMYGDPNQETSDRVLTAALNVPLNNASYVLARCLGLLFIFEDSQSINAPSNASR